MYRNLFKLVGYDEDEILRESKRIEKAFDRAGNPSCSC